MIYIRVYNSMGKQVSTTTVPGLQGVNELQVPVGKLGSGIYYIQVQYGNESKMSKIQKTVGRRALYSSDDDIAILIRGCLRNDRRAQEELYKRFYPAVMALCLRYIRDNHDAVEVVNDSFLKVFPASRSF